MPKEAPSESEKAEAVPPRSTKKRLLIALVALLVVLALGAAGAVLLIKKRNADTADDESVAAETAKPARKSHGKDTIPVYVSMDAFTVNLAPEAGEQYVQLVLSVEVDDAATAEKIKSYTPKIRNNVVMLLSGKKASELLTREGKEKLAEEIRSQINGILAPGAKTNDGPVRDVLFTSFIIQ